MGNTDRESLLRERAYYAECARKGGRHCKADYIEAIRYADEQLAQLDAREGSSGCLALVLLCAGAIMMLVQHLVRS